jgi:hypothetical protein
VCQIHQRYKFCLNIRNNETLPLDLVCPQHLSVQSLAKLPYVLFVGVIEVSRPMVLPTSSTEVL